MPVEFEGGSRRRLLPLYAGFAATGVGVALPGALLPVLLRRWDLPDEGGGNLFLLAFAGSSVGALLVRGNLLQAVALGSLAIALAAAGISLLSVQLAFACVFVFGVGLGVTMTAISLIVQRWTAGSSRALVYLNLLWALGASLCPALSFEALKLARPGAIFFPLAAGFCLLAGWATTTRLSAAPAERAALAVRSSLRGLMKVPGTAGFFSAIPAILILLVMLATGVEASTGGWLATYAKRGGDTLAGVIAAPTYLWLGLLLSRLFWSRFAGVERERRILQGSLLLIVVAASSLLAASHGWLFFAAAFGLGLGLGPIYPLLLAKALRLHASGMIFFLAGAGSAILPWLMGFVSTQSHSLRTGFMVPAAGALMMVVLSLWLPPDPSAAAPG